MVEWKSWAVIAVLVAMLAWVLETWRLQRHGPATRSAARVAADAVAARARKPPTAIVPLTPPEQKMYFRLREARPDLIVLSQVGFGALLHADHGAVRSTFDRKRTDFVLCDHDFEVLAVVELDDWSHDGREAADAARDALLTDAGYMVMRFRGMPEVDELRMELDRWIGPAHDDPWDYQPASRVREPRRPEAPPARRSRRTAA
ncbi:MAG: DUF2726 domain-containing protein [Xylophilus ampelinus]